jgi:hypothetical protein
MALVDAIDKTTGEALPYQVPAHFIGHPVLGASFAIKPAAKRAPDKSAAPKAPAAGSTEKE